MTGGRSEKVLYIHAMHISETEVMKNKYYRVVESFTEVKNVQGACSESKQQPVSRIIGFCLNSH